MKRLILLIALFYSFSFGQGWNSTVPTSISESTLEKMDLFTNKNGNHLLIKRSNGNIVYYNVNSSGTVITSKTTTLESNGDFPAITGTNDLVYAIYKTGSYIKLKYSTNGGSSWVYNSSLDLNIGSNECNGIDAVYEINEGVHLVWAAKDSDPYFETYYYNLKTNFQWDYFKNVTDYAGFQYGSRPTVTFSSNRVHVSFGPLSGGTIWTVATRDRLNGSWQTPQNASGSDYSSVEKLITSGSYIYMIYSQVVPPSYFDLAYKVRTLSGTWSSGSGTDIETNIIGTEHTFDICKTYDNELQLVYELDDAPYGDDLLHRNYDDSWNNPFPVDDNQSFAGDPKRISNASNDFFVVWKRNNSSSLFYRQYDAVPLAPQGLAVNPYQQGNNIYAKLTWQLNNEPDVFIKTTNAYRIERRIKLMDFPWSAWLVVYTPGGGVSEFIDTEVQGAGAERYYAEYRMRAVDYNNHYSAYSSTVLIGFSNYSPTSPVVGGLNTGNKTNTTSFNSLSYDYNLGQNYPNPFNPITQISYSLAQDAFVTLKVYDMLGKEVAELINTGQQAGVHQVNFDASNLSSGIYIYRITAMNGERMLFSESKRMVLMK